MTASSQLPTIFETPAEPLNDVDGTDFIGDCCLLPTEHTPVSAAESGTNIEELSVNR